MTYDDWKTTDRIDEQWCGHCGEYLDECICRPDPRFVVPRRRRASPFFVEEGEDEG